VVICTNIALGGVLGISTDLKLESDPSAQFGLRETQTDDGWRSDLFRARGGEFLDLECVSVVLDRKTGRSENYLRRGGQVLVNELTLTNC
jgi:hypothetical protein